MSDITLVKPCIKCGASQRTKSGACAVCKRARDAAWENANPDKAKAHRDKWSMTDEAKAKRAAWYLANKEKVKACQDAYRLLTVEKRKSTNATWRAKNPEILRNQKHTRRARKLDVGGKLSRDIAARLLELQRGKCACCGLPLGNDYHLDHKMPLALGGPNVDSNMQLLRAICNLQKGMRHPIEFMQSKGFLL